MGAGCTHLGVTKVEVDGLGMANVQDAIGLRREPCPHLGKREGTVTTLIPCASPAPTAALHNDVTHKGVAVLGDPTSPAHP